MDLKELKKEAEKYFLENKNSDNKEILIEILKKYNSNDFENYINFDDKKYCRNIIYQSEFFEILLICWKSKQKSFIHNHPKNGCFMKILKGELKEELYLNNYKKNEKQIKIFKKNDISFICDEIGFHKILNDSENQSISLHIDSPGFYIPKEIEILNNEVKIK